MEVAKIIAKATAKLNSTANWKLYERPYLLHFNQCTQLIEHFAGEKNQYHDFFHFFEQQTKALEKAAAANLPIGLIHGDIFPDNTLFQNNKLIGIIDFEFASTAEVLIEIGVTINGFCFVNNELDMNLLQAFLSSYSKTRKIEPLELNLLHDYILMGTLLMLRWHLNHIMQHTSPKSFQRTSYFIQRMKGFQKMKRINYRMLLQD